MDNFFFTKLFKSLKSKFPKSKLESLEPFIRSFYSDASEDDLRGQSHSSLFFRADQIWKFGQFRKPGESLVRAFNPETRTHQYESTHSVIEIVTKDMPYIIDSLISYLGISKITIFLLIHPTIRIQRKKPGKVIKIDTLHKHLEQSETESYIHLEITRQSKTGLEIIKNKIDQILFEINVCNVDRHLIKLRMMDIVNDIHPLPKGFHIDEVSEVQDFIDWLDDGNFIFFGFREYFQSAKKNKSPSLIMDKKSGLGLLRDPNLLVFEDFGKQKSELPEVRAFMRFRNIILVTKTNRRSNIFRPSHMDAIGIKKFDDSGKVIGHRLFVGLFSPAAYNSPANLVPLLRRRIQAVLEKSGFSNTSHNGIGLKNILETYPRDELFQIDDETLFHNSLAILRLEERPRTACLIRKDELDQFYSCLVFVPREIFSTEIRERIQKTLAQELNGSISAFYTQLDDKPLARCQIIVRAIAQKVSKIKHQKIEARLAHETQSWNDKVYSAMTNLHGEEIASELSNRWLTQFERAYQDLYDAQNVIDDVQIIESTLLEEKIGVNLFYGDPHQKEFCRFKIYSTEGTIPLSDILPIFEHMGFKVIDEKGPHALKVKNSPSKQVTIHDFGLRTIDKRPFDLKKIRENFHSLFLQIWNGNCESDGFNALVVRSNLDWRSIIIIRAYSKFLKQIGITLSQAYMERASVAHPKIIGLIISLFFRRFDPKLVKLGPRKNALLRLQIQNLMSAVVSADEDRILRRFYNLVESTTRTNFFQKTKEGGLKSYISFKFDSQKIEDLPLPRPFREIFVYSPRMEGVHLRFGYIARGGLRWSDRPEDFRTEILGLVKAQQVKNAVIVPVGSKGGFVLKKPPPKIDRNAYLAEGVECYKTLISGMLDLTDNLHGSKIIPPADVICKDDHDPYLVVAADKGTATFSDIANKVSFKYQHWLGDAFASGGSQGYDHKKMGITARGAWESVKLHFREMGKNIQSEDFTVIGIGDMAGDVFGNGMLLSKHIKLIAAFNHMHIFVDPSPIPATSWKERKRLFQLPGSSWAQYDKKAFSPGGAIFERNAKSLTLTKEIQKLFGIPKSTIRPKELINTILKFKAELLWFGGIGTYVKANSESHFDVGDKANDSIRVNASELQFKVIGEGANLGCTQLGRIEFAANGGRMNTDAIDNSAGVDSSDHEVNIKILLGSIMQKGLLEEKSRNKLLAKMTDEVAKLVLLHNYRQSQAISQIQSEGLFALDDQQKFMKMLERDKSLDRKVEFLPDDDEIAERKANQKGLYRPEISVLLSYSKIWLYNQILDSSIPDDPFLDQELINYFPKPLSKSFSIEIKKHRLKREIIATRLSNTIVDRLGDTFVSSLIEETGFSAPEITEAYIITVNVFQLKTLWLKVEGLDNIVPSKALLSMRTEIKTLLRWVILWFLRNQNARQSVTDSVKKFSAGISILSSNIERSLPNHYRQDNISRAQPYIDQGVPKSLALHIANLVNLYFSCDIVNLASDRNLAVTKVAKIYFSIGSRFQLGHLRLAANNLNSEDHWTQLAISTLTEELYSHQLALTDQVIKGINRKFDERKIINDWLSQNKSVVGPTDKLLRELWLFEVNNISMVSVASRQIRSMIQKL